MSAETLRLLDQAIAASVHLGSLVELPYSNALDMQLIALASDHALVSDGGTLTATAYGKRADGGAWGVRLVQCVAAAPASGGQP